MIDYSDIVSALSEALTTPSLSRELVSSLSRSAPNFGEVRLLSDGLALGPFETIKNYWFLVVLGSWSSLRSQLDHQPLKPRSWSGLGFKLDHLDHQEPCCLWAG